MCGRKEILESKQRQTREKKRRRKKTRVKHNENFPLWPDVYTEGGASKQNQVVAYIPGSVRLRKRGGRGEWRRKRRMEEEEQNGGGRG